MERQTAGERLAYGDTAIARRATTSAQAIGLADGLSAEAVAKAMWLARIYPAEARKALGPDLLNELTPSQLEIVAKLESPLRETLLGRAVTQSLSVRDLRELARRETQPSTLTTLGGVTDLASARKALETYASWSEPDLTRLIEGPNGELVRGLAAAGNRLAARLGGGMPSTSA